MKDKRQGKNFMNERYRIQFDPDACRWCRACELICSHEHEGEFAPSCSSIRLVLDQFQAEVRVAVCRQCKKPKCLEACPTGAIIIDKKTRAAKILSQKCDGCGSCVLACPFNREGLILHYSKAAESYTKCDLCGGLPKCVAICPTGALKLKPVGRE
jgi:Fe-S-cluster-containing hydrogenase component 2